MRRVHVKYHTCYEQLVYGQSSAYTVDGMCSHGFRDLGQVHNNLVLTDQGVLRITSTVG
jgi:hypothetical protein